MQRRLMTEVEDRREKIDARGRLHQANSVQLHLLHALNGHWPHWQRTSGKSDHVDVFGEQIPKGRSDYRQGHDYANCNRLSAQSMSLFLHVLFGDNPDGLQLATDLHAASIRRLVEAPNPKSLASSPDSLADPYLSHHSL